MTSSDPAEAAPRTRTFRQGSATVSAVIIMGVAAVFIVAELFDDNRDGVAPILWPLAAVLLTWAVLVRPCVRFVPHGVELRNIVRDATITWPSIDLVESRWALAVVTEDGRDFKSFAITAQRPKRGAGESTAPGGRVRAFGSLAPADPENLAHRSGSAGDVAGRIRVIVEQYERGTARGEVEEVEARAERRPAYTGIAAVAAGLACIVLALLI